MTHLPINPAPDPDQAYADPDHSHASPDQTIARVLQGLRDAAPPTGLEARLLHNLQQRSAIPAPRSLRERLHLAGAITPSNLGVRSTIAQALTRRPVYPLCAALTTAILFAVMVIHRTPAPLKTLSAQNSKLDETHLTHAPQLAPNSTHATLAPPSLSNTHALSSLRPSPPSSIPYPLLSPRPLSPEDRLALEEANAPSQAAPPMPLTAQEHLLLRAVRHGSPIEVAELDQLREPILRAAAAARDRATLQRYAGGIIAPLLAFRNPEPDPTPTTPTPNPIPIQPVPQDPPPNPDPPPPVAP